MSCEICVVSGEVLLEWSMVKGEYVGVAWEI